MTTLQLIIKKAKALRAASPKKFAKWTDYVKAASATIKPKKKATVGAVKKKAAPKKAATKKVVKKAPVKKVIKKAATKKATSIHKDTKSHNVRINVVSGTNRISEDSMNRIKQLKKAVENFEILNEKYKLRLLDKNQPGANVRILKKTIEQNKSYIITLKREINYLKKYI